jgi:uncharacterized membrane protein
MPGILHLVYGWLCHQLPERSPHLGEQVFPLCYRCAGLHLGLLAAFLYLTLSGGWRRRFPERTVALGLCGLLVPLMVDGGGNLLGLWSTPGWLRSATGLSAGVALPLLLVPLASPGGEGERRQRASAPHCRTVLWPVALGLGLLGLLLGSGLPFVFETLAFGALAGTLLFVSCFLLAVARHFRGPWGLRREARR